MLYVDYSPIPSVDSQPQYSQSNTSFCQSSLVEASSPSIQVGDISGRDYSHQLTCRQLSGPFNIKVRPATSPRLVLVCPRLTLMTGTCLHLHDGKCCYLPGICVQHNRCQRVFLPHTLWGWLQLLLRDCNAFDRIRPRWNLQTYPYSTCFARMAPDACHVHSPQHAPSRRGYNGKLWRWNYTIPMVHLCNDWCLCVAMDAG